MYYLGQVPDSLFDIFRRDKLLLSPLDRLRNRNSSYIWLGSSGVVTHTHCDMDHNVFVQVKGKKTFYLAPPHRYEDLAIFPRIHPLWHKSQIRTKISGESPEISGDSPEIEFDFDFKADLEPGDMLYIPPYWFHKVLTHSPSVSITTWSLDYQHYERMDGVYLYEPKYLKLAHPEGRIHTLRLYLDLLIQSLYGRGSTRDFFKGVLSSRYFAPNIIELFPPKNTTLARLCKGEQGGEGVMFLTRKHVLEDTKFDASVMSNLFFEIPPESRDLMLINYVEEISALELGVLSVYEWFLECFDGQGYALGMDPKMFVEKNDEEDEN